MSDLAKRIPKLEDFDTHDDFLYALDSFDKFETKKDKIEITREMMDARIRVMKKHMTQEQIDSKRKKLQDIIAK